MHYRDEPLGNTSAASQVSGNGVLVDPSQHNVVRDACDIHLHERSRCPK